MKRIFAIIGITFILSSVLFLFLRQSRLDETLHWKIYEKLLKTQMKLSGAPAGIKDIVLVTIDNQTLEHMQKQWPFSRSDFAKVINNLNRAGAGVIALDFVFSGESNPEEDAQLKSALSNAKVVLASAINENGMVELFGLPDFIPNVPTGFVTTLQDKDGVTRRNLIYLVDEKDPARGVLSWEMQILKEAKDINLGTLKTKKNIVYFQNKRGARWEVPVERGTSGFLINFSANTVNFQRIPFYRVLENDFSAAQVKDKIVLIGTTSTLLQDIHLTPIGWLPGITLNANALLTLYAKDFLKEVPGGGYLQVIGLLLILIVSACAVSLLRPISGTLFVIMELLLFIVVSYQLFIHNYYWNYSLFPVLVSFCPLWARRIYKFISDKAIRRVNKKSGLIKEFMFKYPLVV